MVILRRSPIIKTKLNKAIKDFKKLVNEKNNSIRIYLRNSSLSETSDYILWKAIKKLKQPQQTSLLIMKQGDYWLRTDQERANTFAEHLVKIFIRIRQK